MSHVSPHTMATPQQVSDEPELTICCICERKANIATQCPRVGFNIHYFCQECVCKKLPSLQQCPVCKGTFTTEEYSLLLSHFESGSRTESSLRQVSCKNADNGCLAKLYAEQRDAHEGNCEYANRNCIDCSATVIKRDLEVHKEQQCPKRQVSCNECGLTMIYELIATHDCTWRRKTGALEKYVNEMVTNAIRKYEEKAFFQERGDVIVFGGCDGGFRLTSMEIFDWCNNAWRLGNEMEQRRSGMTSFFYKQQLYVAGGKWRQGSVDTIEVMSFRPEANQEWSRLPGTRLLSWGNRGAMGSWGHSSVVYKDRLIVIGGYNGETVSNKIYEIHLDPPNSPPTQLCTLRKPIWNHSCQVIDGKIYIFGGMTGSENASCVSDVLEYDIDNNSIRIFHPLPYAVNGHATVCAGNSVIILGGADEQENRLRTVLKYNVDSQRCQRLPPMNHARDGCAAVVTGNALIAVGGYDCTTATGQEYMKSAECFTFGSYEWKELPPMHVGRSYANAVVKPTIH